MTSWCQSPVGAQSALFVYLRLEQLAEGFHLSSVKVAISVLVLASANQRAEFNPLFKDCLSQSSLASSFQYLPKKNLFQIYSFYFFFAGVVAQIYIAQKFLLPEILKNLAEMWNCVEEREEDCIGRIQRKLIFTEIYENEHYAKGKISIPKEIDLQVRNIFTRDPIHKRPICI